MQKPIRIFARALPPLALAAALAGCGDADSPATPPAPVVAAPVVAAEPAHTPGLANTIAWSAEAVAGQEFQAQRADDDAFTGGLVDGPWTDALEHRFDGLVHGRTYHYRVRRRVPDGGASPWSPGVSSTQDAAAPVALIVDLAEAQTGYRFAVDVQLEDDGAGVAAFELWAAVDGGAPALLGTFASSPATVVVDTLGAWGLHAVAVDRAGNRQAPPAAPQALTTVPPRIIITDRQGENFDITHAVNRYFLHVWAWEFGLGRDTIRPLIYPPYLAPGDPGYPRDDLLRPILAINYGGQQRAWALGDISDREAVNDSTGGVLYAATY